MERVAMRIASGKTICALFLGLIVASAPPGLRGQTKTENAKGDRVPPGTVFRTSDRCVACHNGLTTKDGEDISIGFQWRGGILGKSSRGPYLPGTGKRGAD